MGGRGYVVDQATPHDVAAVLAALTTDCRRADAHRFYGRLGWVDSHQGMKLDLTEPPRRPPGHGVS